MIITEKTKKIAKTILFLILQSIILSHSLEAILLKNTVLRSATYLINNELSHQAYRHLQTTAKYIKRTHNYSEIENNNGKVLSHDPKILPCSTVLFSERSPAHKKGQVIVGYNDSLDLPHLNVMNELNQLPIRFPEAISLASGRPADEFCRPEIAASAIEAFSEYAKKTFPIPINRLLGQYGKTNGIINEIIVKHLKVDEDIDAEPENIITTVGFHEAAALCVMTLFGRDDMLLVPDPVFIGISGIASLTNIPMMPVPYKESLKTDDVKNAINKVKKLGKIAKALYIIPDFNNPSGNSLSLEDRKALLSLAKENDFLIIEDNAYSMFRYEGEKIPSLKSLDKDGIVIYLGTFAKTLYPALRMGYIVVDQYLKDKNGKYVSVIGEMTKVKSYITVNTPALDQAVVGGLLIKNDYSLKSINEEKIKYYRHNREEIQWLTP